MKMKKLASGRWQVRWRDETRKQRAKNFRSKERAEEFIRQFYRDEKSKTEALSSPQDKTLADVVEEWRRRAVISDSTRINYENKIRLHLQPLMPMRVRSITPRTIDLWIDEMKRDPDRYGKGSIRQNFKQELKTLAVLLRYYAEYTDDDTYQFPLKARHRKAVVLRCRQKAAPKDLTEALFKRFADELCDGQDGEQMKALATIQFYHALRISEVAALYWEDVHFDHAEPWRSRLVVSRHVLYLRKAGVPDREDDGFKNSASQGGVKEHPLMPAAYRALRALWREGLRGRIFNDPVTGEFWGYRVIQGRFNRAFERLGMPYRSTHVMRHGGTRRTYDGSGGDIGVAQQLLGNASRQTVDVYAKRHAGALTEFVHGEWVRTGGALKVHAQTPTLTLVKDDE